MTQEEKDLLFKDLCSRLPYGLKCRTSRKNGIIRIKNCVLDCHWLIEVQNDIYKIKPYLFPLSSMTEEQRENLMNICGERIGFNSGTFIDFNGYGEIPMKSVNDVIDWLNANHFDYRGLIEKELAIDATNLGIYKKEAE